MRGGSGVLRIFLCFLGHTISAAPQYVCPAQLFHTLRNSRAGGAYPLPKLKTLATLNADALILEA